MLKQQGCRKGKESKKTRQAKSHPRHSHRDSIYRLQRLLELDEIYVGGKRTGKRGHGAGGKQPVLVAVETRREVLGPGFFSGCMRSSASRSFVPNELISARSRTFSSSGIFPGQLVILQGLHLTSQNPRNDLVTQLSALGADG
ncbi:transposase [Desulfopila sp. IMCC35006]|nr:transposase [Desulfopila sp. IMCC35006]